MTSHAMAHPAVPEPYWPLDEHITGALAEALLAEQQHRIDPATVWHGPHTPLQDVSRDGMSIDAKSAWHTPEGVGFMGSGRKTEVRAGVSHYALVVLDVAATKVRLIASRQSDRGLDVEGHVEGVIYLVDADVVNQHARAATRRDGVPGTGRNLYLLAKFLPTPIPV